MSTFKTSATQQTKMRARERFSGQAYKDGETNGVQNYSIGYGHQIRANEQTLKRRTITKQEANALFASDLSPIEVLVGNAVPKVNQNQGDALVDFGYNCGTGALALVLTTWKTTKGDVSATTGHMAKYTKTHENGVLVNSAELMSRRAESNALFSTPVKAVAMFATLAVAVGLYLLKA